MALRNTSPLVDKFQWPSNSELPGDVDIDVFQSEFDIEDINWDLVVWWNEDLARAAIDLSERGPNDAAFTLPPRIQTALLRGGPALEQLIKAVSARVPRSELRCSDHMEQAISHILRVNADGRNSPFMLYDARMGVWKDEHQWLNNKTGTSVASAIDRVMGKFSHAMSRAVDLLYFMIDGIAPVPAKLGPKPTDAEKTAFTQATDKRKAYTSKINEAREMARSISRGEYRKIKGTLRTRLGTEQLFWDSDTRWLVLKDGVLDLEDVLANQRCDVLEHSPFYRSTMVLDVGWTDTQRNAGKSEWERGVEKVLPDLEIRSYLQRRFGAALLGTPAAAGKSMVWQFGPGDTAKSTLQECIAGAKGVFAPYSHQGSSEALTREGNRKGEGERFKAYARGKRFAIMSEMNDGELIDAAILKQVTGGDTVQGTAKYSNSVEYFFTATLFLASNHPPKFPPGDTALIGRIHVVPFTHRLWDQSKNPVEWADAGPENRADVNWAANVLRNSQERSAILHWVIAGLMAFGRDGGIGELPETMKVARSEFAEDVDVVGQLVRSLLGEGVGYEGKPHLHLYKDREWKAAGFKERDGLEVGQFDALVQDRARDLKLVSQWEELPRKQLLAARRMLHELGGSKKKVLLESGVGAYAFTRVRYEQAAVTDSSTKNLEVF